MLGNTLGPEEAYRFARGEEVRSAAGLRVHLIRPVDTDDGNGAAWSPDGSRIAFYSIVRRY
jgi:hypothetical protein